VSAEDYYFKLADAEEQKERHRESSWLKKLLAVVFVLCVVAVTSMLLFSTTTKGFPSCATASGIEVSRHCDADKCNPERWCGADRPTRWLGFLCKPGCARPTVVCESTAAGDVFELAGPCVKSCAA